MRKSLVILILLMAQSALASPMFEGLTWMTNVGGSVALLNLLFGFVISQVYLKPKKNPKVKSLLFGVVQFVLTILSIPLSWMGTSWLVYWIKGLEKGGNAFFVLGLFILPAMNLIFLFYRAQKNAK